MTIDSGKFLLEVFWLAVIDINSGQIRNCGSVNNNLRYSYGTSIEAGYVYSYRSNRIHKFPLNQSGMCPSSSSMFGSGAIIMLDHMLAWKLFKMMYIHFLGHKVDYKLEY